MGTRLASRTHEAGASVGQFAIVGSVYDGVDAWRGNYSSLLAARGGTTRGVPRRVGFGRAEGPSAPET